MKVEEENKITRIEQWEEQNREEMRELLREQDNIWEKEKNNEIT